MANLASSIARVVLNLTSATPQEGWPNFGSVIHNAWTGKTTGLGTELAAAAGILPPFHGTDIPSGGGVKQNIAMFTYNRYCQYYEYKLVRNDTESGPGSGGRYNRRYFAYVSEHVVTHTPDIRTNVVGIGIDWFFLNRASAHHESYGGSHISARAVYRTADAPTVNKHVNFGYLGRMGTAHGWPKPQQHFSRAITAAAGVVYVQLIVQVAHGMGNWHDVGDRSPANWSPNTPICNDTHACGVGANFVRSIGNGSISGHAFADYRTVYYKPTPAQLNPPRSLVEAHQILNGNGNWYKVRDYQMPNWIQAMP